MYLKSIRLRNIKCFADATVDFSSGDSVRRWTTFFGRNGLGKSTLLQAIGAVLAGPSAVRELLPTADGWVRKGQAWGEIIAQVLQTEGDSSVKRARVLRPYEIRYLVTGSDPSLLPASLEEKPTVPEIVAWSGEGEPNEKVNLTKDRKLLQQTAYAEDQKGWLACGYGPFRRLSGGAEYANQIVARQRRSARFVTLFREDAALTNATAWLLERYSAAREEPTIEAKKLEVVKQAIAEKLLPETAGLVLNARTVKLRRHDGSETSFQDLSDGYRSMLALSVDLLRWLTQAFPDEDKPLECPGVVVVDELDAHLHPDWQRRIGHWLREKFPNLQFIVATHSPFLAQVAGEDSAGGTSTGPAAEGDAVNGNIKLEESAQGVHFVGSTEPARNLQADQILQSELFALKSLYAGPVEDRLDQYRGLRAKKRQGSLSAEEEAQFQQLELWANTLPQTATTAEREDETIVRQALDRHVTQVRELE